MDATAASKPIKSRRVVVDFDLLRRVSGTNFRDLGGHPTRDKRRVREGMVYRSAHLAELAPDSPLRSLALRTLVTLQSRLEVSHLGPPVAALRESARWEHIPIGDRWFEDDDFAAMTSVPGREHLALVTYFRENWRAFFNILADGEAYPLLFHCSAGRDRTGVGAAMLLDLLGVERDRIVSDFLESNAVFRDMPLSPAQLEPVFETIDASGGIRGFMQDVIEIEPGRIEAIRSHLLQD